MVDYSVKEVWRVFASVATIEYYRPGGLKRQTFISPSSEGWEVQDQGSCRFSVWRAPSSWLAAGCHFTVFSHGRQSEIEGLRDLSCVSASLIVMDHARMISVLRPLVSLPFVIRTLILSWGLHPNDCILFPNTPSPDVITLEVRVSTCEFGGRHKYCQ